MSLKKFKGLLKAYKDTFDLEMLLTKTVTTYEKNEQEIGIDDVIPF